MESKTELEMRIIFKSRVPMPHLKSKNIIENGIFNVGGFMVSLDDKKAFIDWDNSLVQVVFDKDDYLIMMANMYSQVSEDIYDELNESIENVIPFEEIYKIETLTKSTFEEISYEAYEKDYDGSIIPMDVFYVNLAKVEGFDEAGVLPATYLLEDANYSEEKLAIYNEREDIKWRLEGVKDPKTIHNTTGDYTSCLA